MKYQLTEEATRDVEEILAYSVNSFGIAQTEHYFEALKECIELLAGNPDIGHSAEDILPEYFTLSIRKPCDFLQKTYLVNSCGEDTP